MKAEAQQIREWRFSEFKRLGYSPSLARWLSGTDIDLHELERLLESGCDKATATKILWPL